MAAQVPLVAQRLADLADPPFNISERSFRHNHLAVESDQYICVKDVAEDGTGEVVVIDLVNNNNVSRRSTKKAEAALMHTKRNVLVLKGRPEDGVGHFIQVFDLDTKTRLLEHPFAEDIVFWKWVQDDLLAVVTTASVWHCSLEEKVPQKIFDRGGKLIDSQIIHYAVDATVKWCLLAGISTQDKKTIDGTLQLYSIERQQQQLLDGYAGCFGSLVIDESRPAVGVFSFVERKGSLFRLHVMDIYAPRGEGVAAPFKATAEFSFSPEEPLDFPIAESLDPKSGLIYLVSRGGNVAVLEAMSGVLICQHKFSNDTVFVCCPNRRSGGVIFVNRKGHVFAAAANRGTVVPYMEQNLRHIPNLQNVVKSLAVRYGYSGADEVIIKAFNAAFARGDFATAARLVATMHSGALRTQNTINQFKTAPTMRGQTTSAILVYFSTLLEHSTLTEAETLELVRPVVSQGRREFIVRWLDEGKLTCSEELGDAVKPLDSGLAARIYGACNAHQKTLQCYIECGEYEKIIAFAKSTNFPTDYGVYLRSAASVNPAAAVRFARELLEHNPPLLDVNLVVDIFTQMNKVPEITSILLNYLKGNKPEHAHLQTRLFEINLMSSPQVAEAIFQMGTFSHYDKTRVSQLCEKAGLVQRALENCNDNAEIKRILAMHSVAPPGSVASQQQVNPEWLSNYFGRLSPDTCLECLTDLLRSNRQNLQLVVQTAVKHHQMVGTQRIITMFENFGSWEGIFYFLGSILAFVNNPDVHFKYIEAAAKLNHIQEVERVCRESTHYDPVRVKDFLKQAKLADPRPLIYVCDRNGFVVELAEYLYKNSLLKFIEIYAAKANSNECPTVVGTLIDLDCSEDFIRQVLLAVRAACPAASLIEEVEKRNRLRLILPWLEARMQEGTQEAAVHNALAKIYIDINRDPEEFLKTNAYYDSLVLGKYCEDRDPHLAYTAYRKNWGHCDKEIIALTNKNGLFRLQARYLVERQSADLWATVLTPENEYRQLVVDQVVGSALPESSSAEEVSATVRAFIVAELPSELMELLEKIVLHNSDFSENKNLQNLLILTAIKSNPSKVMDYINRLEFYDGPEIAQVALSSEYSMFEVAATIYKKINRNEDAMDVFINNIRSLERAGEFASRCDQPTVWSKLGTAQLEAGLVSEAIGSFIKADDASAFADVIQRAEEQSCYVDLITFLTMARKSLPIKNPTIDSELVYALAKCERISEMEEFAMGSNTANVVAVGDRLFEEEHYVAAKALYASAPHYSKLAACHLKLGDFYAAVEAAKRGGSPKTWKQVNVECVKHGEFRCAHVAGLAIVAHPDHLEELVQNYERGGHFDELIALLEAGVNASERGSPGALNSELGIAYTKYRPERLPEFLKSTSVISGRLNIPKLIRACEQRELWSEALILHLNYGEFDQAAVAMMQHPSSCWNHDEFASILANKVSNSELYFKALSFYLGYAPQRLNNLLLALAPKLDHVRVLQHLRSCPVGGCDNSNHLLALVKGYLEHVQSLQFDIAVVNDALNLLFVEDEDFDAVERSVSENCHFDQLSLAKQLQAHPRRRARQLACKLYREHQMFEQAISLAKVDGDFHGAMEAARKSGSPELAEQLLRYFAFELNDRDCFAACLFMCYPLLKPDVVLELAFVRGFTDQAIPYMIQAFRDFHTRIESLEKKVGLRESQADREKSAPNDYVPNYSITGMAPTLPGMENLMLMPPPPGISIPDVHSGVNGALSALIRSHE